MKMESCLMIITLLLLLLLLPLPEALLEEILEPIEAEEVLLVKYPHLKVVLVEVVEGEEIEDSAVVVLVLTVAVDVEPSNSNAIKLNLIQDGVVEINKE